MLSLVIETAILVAVVFEAIIGWKHYQLALEQANAEIRIPVMRPGARR